MAEQNQNPNPQLDLQRAIASQKSYVGPSVIVFILYMLGYLPGLIFNTMWLSEASKTKKLTGQSPAGIGCLYLMFFIGLLPLIALFLICSAVATAPPTRVQAPQAEQPTSFAAGFESAQAEWQRNQAREEFEALKAKKEQADQAKELLAKFRVAQPRLLPPDRENFENGNTVDMWVKNETGVPVARAFFRFSYATPGRALPWVEGQMNYEISGGLEHEERANWRLKPNMFSDLGKAEIRADAVLVIETTKLLGPGGAVIASSDWTAEDEARFAELSRILAPPTAPGM